jgi:c-di-GMP-binding flagellar brake protein YcgR
VTPAHVHRDMRKHSRRQLDLPVLVSDTSNRVKAAIRFGAADISEDGAFLRSDLLFEVGEILNLEIQLSPTTRLRTRGRVVRVSRDEAAPGMGIEFVELSPQDRAAIDQALSEGEIT